MLMACHLWIMLMMLMDAIFLVALEKGSYETECYRPTQGFSCQRMPIPTQ